MPIPRQFPRLLAAACLALCAATALAAPPTDADIESLQKATLAESKLNPIHKKMEEMQRQGMDPRESSGVVGAASKGQRLIARGVLGLCRRPRGVPSVGVFFRLVRGFHICLSLSDENLVSGEAGLKLETPFC